MSTAELERLEQENGGGDCYTAAFETFVELLETHAQASVRLVHGRVHGQGPLTGVTFGHAWVELEDSLVLDNSNGRALVMLKSDYYKMGGITDKDVAQYSLGVVQAHFIATEHAGPWEQRFYNSELVKEANA